MDGELPRGESPDAANPPLVPPQGLSSLSNRAKDRQHPSMSDGGTGEKTEEPTPQKLKQARDKGQVSKSQDFIQALLFVGVRGGRDCGVL